MLLSVMTQGRRTNRGRRGRRRHVRRVLGYAAAMIVTGAAVGSAQDAPQPVREAQPAEPRLQFYGVIRHDVIFDDSRPDAAQTPLFIPPEEDGASDRANFTMHPRLTRFGVNLSGPELDRLGHARIAGRFELDFQNGGRESRALPRYRHAYLTLSWRTASILIGQTSDIISPLFPSVNGDTLMWNAGNLGDRRAQVRATFASTGDRLRWSLDTGVGLTGAVDEADLDEDGVRDGEAAALPSVQARFGMSYPSGSRRLAFGVWMHTAQVAVTIPVAGQQEFSSHAVGLDAELPLGRRMIVRGEIWAGRNLSDVRGGIGQGVNAETGRSIDSRGGWIEIGRDLSSWYSLFGGYTVDAPDADDLPLDGRSRNRAWYIVNRLTVGQPLVFGIDYLRWRTDHVGARPGTDNRLNAYVTYNF